MRICVAERFLPKKSRQQQNFDSDLKGAWHHNHVTFTPIAQFFCKGGDTRELQSRVVPPKNNWVESP